MRMAFARSIAKATSDSCRCFGVKDWEQFNSHIRSMNAEPVVEPAVAERRLAAQIEHLRSILLGGADPSPDTGPPPERFHALFLDNDRGLVGETSLGNGAVNALVLSVRDLFGYALGCDAKGMIIAHNHPSGDSRPSHYDIDATNRLASVARALDIELLDHLIFTHSAVYSMRARENL